MKTGQIYKYKNPDIPYVYQVGSVDIAGGVYLTLTNLSTGQLVLLDAKPDNIPIENMVCVGSSIEDYIKNERKELDITKLKAFSKYLEEIDDDGYIYMNAEFKKHFPTRTKQMGEFAKQVIEEIIIPYAKKMLDEKDK